MKRQWYGDRDEKPTTSQLLSSAAYRIEKLEDEVRNLQKELDFTRRKIILFFSGDDPFKNENQQPYPDQDSYLADQLRAEASDLNKQPGSL